MAPHITAFVFTLGRKLKITDKIPATLVNGKNMKQLPCYTTFKLADGSSINLLVLLASTSAAMCWKDAWITGGWKVLVIISSLCVPFLIMGILEFIESTTSKLNFNEGNMKCIKHGTDECLECIGVYGLYLERYYYFEACAQHENKKPYESSIPSSQCEKCKMINFRYILHYIKQSFKFS